MKVIRIKTIPQKQIIQKCKRYKTVRNRPDNDFYVKFMASIIFAFLYEGF